MALSYHEAKTALQLFKKSELRMGQLYALECIAEGITIDVPKFPETIYNRMDKYKKDAAYFLSTEKYRRLTKEDAKAQYVSFVKMMLERKHNEIHFANKILTDKTISSWPSICQIN